MTVDDEHHRALARAKELLQEKDRREEDIRALVLVLESQGVGMDESLVDAEGFPRADIDVYQVRHARSQIVRLRNDYKDFTKQVELALHEVHRTRGTQPAASSKSPVPFALVAAVAPDSPAYESGLLPNDRILKFGSIDITTAMPNLKNVLDLVSKSVDGGIIPVLVERDNAQRHVTLRPHAWSGRGSLGCVIKPYP